LILAPPNTKIFNSAKIITSKLKNSGFECYFVGGSVRDIILGKECKDWDITTSALPHEIKKLFRKTISVGESFGVIIVLQDDIPFEVATFRSDGEYTDGRRPSNVRFTDAKEDVLRRDFTINGLLMDPETYELVDYVGGVSDIQKGIVRTIGLPQKRFTEDKLRLMRAIRFAGRFGFKIEDNTLLAVKKMAGEITIVSVERQRDEIQKIITNEGAAKGLNLLFETGIMEYVLPEIHGLKEVEQNPIYHPEGDVLIHTINMFSHIEFPVSPILAWALLLHDVGKKSAAKVRKGKMTFYYHEKIGSKLAGKILDNFKFPNSLKSDIVSLIGDHMKLANISKVRNAKFLRLLAKELKYPHLQEGETYFSTLMQINKMDSLSSNGDLTDYHDAKKRAESVPEGEEKPTPLINGRDLIALGLNPCPDFKKILNEVFDAQLENRVSTHDQAIEFVKPLIDKCRSI
jgi:poly(A) polymerase